MPDLHVIHQEVTDRLARSAFGGLGCTGYGIALLEGASTWGSHESGVVSLPSDDGWLTLPIAYDEREAPYVTDEQGDERTGTLISLSDEGLCVACVWATVPAGSPLVGVGIDLANAGDFGRDDVDYARLLLTERERTLAPSLHPDDLSLAHATLFGAKEAAFKATAAPLRTWYRHHDDELRFEVRDFAMEELGIERGEARRGRAQQAMDRMHIGRIQVYHAEVDGMALVVALAFRDDERGGADGAA